MCIEIQNESLQTECGKGLICILKFLEGGSINFFYDYCAARVLLESTKTSPIASDRASKSKQLLVFKPWTEEL